MNKTQPKRSPVLVIGYGNTLRSDDAVGPIVAERLAALDLPGLQAMSWPLLPPEVAEHVSRAETVYFVDATVEPNSTVTLRPIVPCASSQMVAHSADPVTILAMARDVFGYAPRGFWVTIPVCNLEIGEGLSPLARDGVEKAIELIVSREQADRGA